MGSKRVRPMRVSVRFVVAVAFAGLAAVSQLRAAGLDFGFGADAAEKGGLTRIEDPSYKLPSYCRPSVPEMQTSEAVCSPTASVGELRAKRYEVFISGEGVIQMIGHGKIMTLDEALYIFVEIRSEKDAKLTDRLGRTAKDLNVR